jgi:hypothetical protein
MQPNEIVMREVRGTAARKFSNFLESKFSQPEGWPFIQPDDLFNASSDLVARSFPANDDRAGLLAMIESTVEGDKMDVGAHWTPEGVRFGFRSAVLSAGEARLIMLGYSRASTPASGAARRLPRA